LQTAVGYQQQGVASWYGKKFHNHLTANGEVFNMFAMTAAHKTLPLPSFVRVTNLVNNKSVIVRVNDRGPFHSQRIIDLSYAAAYALGITATGTAQVEVTTITPSTAAMTATTQQFEKIKELKPIVQVEAKQQLFIQVIASSNRQKLSELAEKLAVQLNQNYQLQQKGALYRLRLGPLKNKEQAQQLLDQLQNSGYNSAYMLYSS